MLLFIFPLYLISRADAAGVSKRREMLLRSVVVFFAVIVIVLRFSQFWLAPYMERNPNRMQYPSAELAEQLKQQGFNGGTIIGDSNLTASNIGLYFDGARILSPKTEFFTVDNNPPSVDGQCLIAWNANRRDLLPNVLSEYLRRQGIVVTAAKQHYISAPYQYTDRGEHRIGYILLGSETICNNAATD